MSIQKVLDPKNMRDVRDPPIVMQNITFRMLALTSSGGRENGEDTMSQDPEIYSSDTRILP